MINCGGGVNILDYFTLVENVVVYVIDSHRPYSAQNIVDESSVCLFSLYLSFSFFLFCFCSLFSIFYFLFSVSFYSLLTIMHDR